MKTDNIIIFPKSNPRISKGLSQGVPLGGYNVDCPSVDEIEQMIAHPSCFEPYLITHERQRRINIEVKENMPQPYLKRLNYQGKGRMIANRILASLFNCD